MNVVREISFEVAGTPRPQKRPKGRLIKPKHGGKPFIHIYTPDTAQEFMKAVMGMAAIKNHGHAPWDQACRVTTTAFFKRPEWMRCPTLDALTDLPHIETPDRDNLDKAVLDATTRAKVWTDDCIVFDGAPRKFWADAECQAGVWVQIEFIELPKAYIDLLRQHRKDLEAGRLKRKGKGGLFPTTTSKACRPRGRLSTQQARAMGLNFKEQ